MTFTCSGCKYYRGTSMSVQSNWCVHPGNPKGVLVVTKRKNNPKACYTAIKHKKSEVWVDELSKLHKKYAKSR